MKVIKRSAIVLLPLLGGIFMAMSSGYLNKGLILSKLLVRHEMQVVPLQKKIRAKHNPIVLPKYCGEPRELSLNFRRLYSEIGASTVRLFINDQLYKEQVISQEQWPKKDAYFSSSQNSIWLDFTMPVYEPESETARVLRVEYYTENELTETIELPVQYVEEGERVPVIYKNDDFFFSNCEVQAFADPTASPLLPNGKYVNNMTCTRTISRKRDHYQVLLSWSGNDVYEQGKLTRSFELPTPRPVHMQLPLSYELAEGTKKMRSAGYYTIEGEFVGKRFGYKIGTEMVGYEQQIAFVNCEQVVENGACILLPSSFGLALID